MYTQQQRQKALVEYDHVKSVSVVIQHLGYPTRTAMYRWLSERQNPIKKKSAFRGVNTSEHPRHPSVEVKMTALHRCFELGEDVKCVSQEIEYSRASIYAWRKKYMAEGTLALMTTGDVPRGKMTPDSSSQEFRKGPEMENFKKQITDLQLEVDLLKETLNVLKKDPGIDFKILSNREKAVIVDAMKQKYPLPLLILKMNLAKSSYYYQKKVQEKAPKYETQRVIIRDIFYKNRQCYGYRRLKAVLDRSAKTLSEKVVRRIMREEHLEVIFTCRRKYSSYKGEISSPAPDLIKRDFHAEKPNEKWLTDITEFAIPAGKVYLSAIIDCYDGLVVSWNASESPNAELANSTLDDALNTLGSDRPILHSDRGCHYRWLGWLNRIQQWTLKRSMSRKGCSPDNAACEGFWGRMKNECFYGRIFKEYNISRFIEYIDDYIQWYNNKRIKISLSNLSPMEFRRLKGYIS